jgi:hypothetical protein
MTDQMREHQENVQREAQRAQQEQQRAEREHARAAASNSRSRAGGPADAARRPGPGPRATVAAATDAAATYRLARSAAAPRPHLPSDRGRAHGCASG